MRNFCANDITQQHKGVSLIKTWFYAKNTHKPATHDVTVFNIESLCAKAVTALPGMRWQRTRQIYAATRCLIQPRCGS
jgi:hypothetical protein